MYDYIDENLKDYASLDTSKVESKPVYQSQVNIEGDLVRSFCGDVFISVVFFVNKSSSKFIFFKNKQIPSASGETSTAGMMIYRSVDIDRIFKEGEKDGESRRGKMDIMGKKGGTR